MKTLAQALEDEFGAYIPGATPEDWQTSAEAIQRAIGSDALREAILFGPQGVIFPNLPHHPTGPDVLDAVAAWMDRLDDQRPPGANRDVQAHLREWANRLRAALDATEPDDRLRVALRQIAEHDAIDATDAVVMHDIAELALDAMNEPEAKAKPIKMPKPDGYWESPEHFVQTVPVSASVDQEERP